MVNQTSIEVENSQWIQGDNLKAGQIYEFQSVHSTMAIAYSEYANFRDSLARISGFKPISGKARPYLAGAYKAWDEGSKSGVLALLNFTDSHGEIGNDTCRQILQGLKTLPNTSELAEHNQERLAKLIETFSFAVNSGFVKFH